jgi:hypothetical protein
MSDMFPIWWALACGLLFLWMNAADARDRNVPAEFRKIYACPATGLKTGPCPGWNIDHHIPLCAGGPDTIANMNWMSIEDHKAKTKLDMKECRKR